MDIAQLPNLPEKASESSETSDSESESKDNSGTTAPPTQRARRARTIWSPATVRWRPRRADWAGWRTCTSRWSTTEMETEGWSCTTRLPLKKRKMMMTMRKMTTALKTVTAPPRLSPPPLPKWDGSRPKRMCLSSATPSSNTFVGAVPLLPPPSPASASVLKIKTEMSEPINFDNDSIIWNYPPNREISRNESPYSMTKPVPAHDTFPSPQPGSLQASIPDSVLTPPGTEGGSGGAGTRKGVPPSFSGYSSAPSSASSAASLAPPSGSGSSSDPLSPPLSASPRDNQQCQSTPTTSGSSLLYTSDLESLQRLQAGNVALPLVQRVTGTLATTSTAAYTTGTIRYAPADVTLAMQAGANLLPNNVAHAMNFVDVNGSPSFGIDPKTPMEMLYHHVHRLNMAGPFGGTMSGASLTQMPAANVFTTAEGLFSTLPFPVYSNGIHTTQTLERKED
ncbi:unnamed protein product [Oncorhynchus mykiss]|uniref:Neuronal PAS domain protein 3 n=1 Tax=Oncorhynchus mykiss TaxID=8022 RepID=A0A060WGK3_ONCMY|nr:unnamed protein product [Oncorhynchus mykiss]